MVLKSVSYFLKIRAYRKIDVTPEQFQLIPSFQFYLMAIHFIGRSLAAGKRAPKPGVQIRIQPIVKRAIEIRSPKTFFCLKTFSVANTAVFIISISCAAHKIKNQPIRHIVPATDLGSQIIQRQIAVDPFTAMQLKSQQASAILRKVFVKLS
ncbi:hypothetical protein, partial [uncultured Bacteroides sp.]|uniref:hypothetical protein n=1 Tax=uncultured Bacteroides sp. TaxID=162156 RepID=UPI002594BCE3